MTPSATTFHCLVLLVFYRQSTHRACGAAAPSKKTEIWQIDVLPGPPQQRPLPPAPSQKLGLDLLSQHDLSGDSFGQPLLTQSMEPHFPMQSSGWQPQPHPDCGGFGKTDLSILAPIFTFVIGFVVIVPLVGLLALAKMQLWQQLTGGGTTTPTVTTTVGGKEDALARRLADAWPVFKEALGKYVDEDSKKVE